MPKTLKAQNFVADIINTDGNTTLDFQRNNGSLLRFTTTDRVGLGTTSPGAKLDVKSTINLTSNDNVSTQALFASKFGYTGSNYYSIVIGSTSNSNTICLGYDPSINPGSDFQGDGREIVIRNNAEFISPNTGNTNFLRYLLTFNNGKIGIGARSNGNSTSANLDIIKTTQITDIDSADQILHLKNTSTDAAGNLAGLRFRLENGTNASQGFIGLSSTGSSSTRSDLIIATPNTSGNSIERIRIRSNGFVGINTLNSNLNHELTLDTNIQSYTDGIEIRNSSNWGQGNRIVFTVPLTNGGALGEAAAIQQHIEGTSPNHGFTLRFYTAAPGTPPSLTERLRIRSNGQISAVSDGSATIPSFSSATQTTTGLYFPATNSIALSTNGTQRLRISSAGGVNFDGGTNYGTTGQVLLCQGDAPPIWSTPNLLASTGPSVTWDANATPRSLGLGLRLAFVNNGTSGGNFPNYGSVLNGSSYAATEDGGVFQFYFPYSSSFGGTSIAGTTRNSFRYRLGQYNNAGWTSWKTVVDWENDVNLSGRNNEANKLVVTDANGYIQAGWINTTSGQRAAGTAISRIYCSDDGYIRYLGFTDFKMQMGQSAKNSYKRSDSTADTHYWVGSLGWSAGNDANNANNLNNIHNGGSAFIDVWASTNMPSGLTHVHGFQSMHYTTGSYGTIGGSSGYGIQVVGSYAANQLWHRSISNGTWGSWCRIISSDQTNSANLVPNTTTSYAPWTISGSKGSYGGLACEYSGVATMFDGGHNGGFYRQTGTGSNRWYFYHHFSNNCTGINTSTTSSSYGMYVNKAIYSTDNIIAYSDARKKTDIRTISSALNIINKLRGVYYKRIDDSTEKEQSGVIAQEVKEVFPHVVTYAKDLDEYGVSYGNFAGLFIEAFKEQSQLINNLKTELDQLKQMVLELKNK